MRLERLAAQESGRPLGVKQRTRVSYSKMDLKGREEAGRDVDIWGYGAEHSIWWPVPRQDKQEGSGEVMLRSSLAV